MECANCFIIYLESLEPLEDLTLKQLSYKTVLLLALTSAARAHGLSSLDLTSSLRKEGSWNLLSPQTSRPPGLVTQTVRYFFLRFRKILRSVLFAALQPTWTGQRSYVPPQSCLCPIFPHSKPFQASPCLDGYPRPYGWQELNKDTPVTLQGELPPLQRLQQGFLLNLSWKQPIGLPRRLSNAFITENSLVVPLLELC